MKLRAIDIQEIRLRLRQPFVTSLGRTEDRRVILVRVEDEDGAEGWGECTSDENPYYSEEWVDGSWLILRDYLLPLAAGRSFSHPSELAGLFGHVRGHRMAKAAVENACWHLEAQRRGIPLWRLLGGRREFIVAGVSIGLQSSVDELIAKIEVEIAAGYRRVKIKIKPGNDRLLIERVRARFPDLPLMADANSAYSLSDMSLFEDLDRFNLMMIEQPLAHDDLFDHATLQKRIATAVCLDESIVEPSDAVHAIELGSCRIVNVKLGRVGGYTSALKIERICRDAGLPVWCGGMLESGIGRAHNIALSTLEGFSLPGDISASARYWEHDIIDPPVTVTPDGLIEAPATAGLGFTVDRERVDRLTVRRERAKV